MDADRRLPGSSAVLTRNPEPAMHVLFLLLMIYLAVGAVLFAHPRGPAAPPDFDWKSQITVFCDSLPEVLGWPLALWRWLR